MIKLRLSEGEGLAPDLIAQKWLPRGDRNPSSQILKSSEAREIQKVKESVNHSVVSDSLRPIDCSLPGSTVRGILQAKILEWVATPPGNLVTQG